MEPLTLAATAGLGYYLNRKEKILPKEARKQNSPNSQPSGTNIYKCDRIKKNEN